MDIRRLSPRYAVSPQIDVTDVPTIAAEGFGTIICNRPDAEIFPPQQIAAMQQAAQAAGLTFVINEVTHHGLNQGMVDIQRAAIDADNAPTFAYCASGTRSTIVWALGQATDVPSAELIGAAAEHGYDISGLRAELDRRFNA